MKKSNLEKIDCYKQVIGIEEFVMYYLNDGQYIDCHKMTHKNLKSFQNPNVMTVSFEFASSNIELVFSNRILLVRDCKNHIAPYINPLELQKIDALNQIDFEIQSLKKERIYQLRLICEYWYKLQGLLARKEEIEQTIQLLKEMHKHYYVEERMKEYVKKY